MPHLQLGISPNSISIAQDASARVISAMMEMAISSSSLGANRQTDGTVDACDLFIGKAHLL